MKWIGNADIVFPATVSQQEKKQGVCTPRRKSLLPRCTLNACGEEGEKPFVCKSRFPLLPRVFRILDHFQFEMLCISNHTACRFVEKARFSAQFGPGSTERLAFNHFQS